jgi:hypothetical protein
MGKRTGEAEGAGQGAQVGTLYERLTAISREAFDAGRYDVAYHTLAAALDCAEEEGNVEQISAVEHAANEQLRFIDQHAPDYHHSTVSAASRGHTSIFKGLSKQAHARLLILRREHKGVEGPLPWPGNEETASRKPAGESDAG